MSDFWSGAQQAEAEEWIAFLKQCCGADECLYMVIDAAQDERIYQIILKTQNSKCCLFSDENTSATIKAVAPHLIKIKRMDESIDWCIREGLRRHWIVFFVSNIVHVSDLRLHFKRFSVVQGPERKQYLFRFYDPRVLPAFIASNEQARSEFFRHLLKIWIPQISDNGSLQRLEFTRHQAAVLSAPAFS